MKIKESIEKRLTRQSALRSELRVERQISSILDSDADDLDIETIVNMRTLGAEDDFA